MDALITILPGDGIGPEVAEAGKDVIKAISDEFGHNFKFSKQYIGGAAMDEFNNPLPENTIASCQDSNAVILGAVGGPKWDDPNSKIRPEQGLLRLRECLKVFANIRPVTIYPSLVSASPLKEERLENVDMLVIRELTGGIYFGEKSRNNNSASDLCVYHDYEVERIIRIAANLAKSRKSKLCSVDKANVLETSRFWRNITTKLMASEFPKVKLEHILVDAAAMYLINKPADFDVIVTENMFGDILTDEASMLAGSMGMLPSASIGDDSVGLYEPIHGSAPDISGQGIANPCGMIGSVAMLLRYSLKLNEEADLLEKALYTVIENGFRTADIAYNDEKILTTKEMTKEIINQLKNKN